jgi:predicted nuclease of predicted toxin-antitoxin system
LNLLLEENLSPRLIQRLAPLFPGLAHVRNFGLKRASDETIWEWARENSYTIITTDADFVALSGSRGWPPKVVHLEECDFPLSTIEELLRQNAVRISEFDRDSRNGVLAIRFTPDRRF